MTTSTDINKGPGRGRRAVTPTSTAPAQALQMLPMKETVPTPESLTDRTFELTTDEDVLTLVHAFNTVGLSAVVFHSADGAKKVKV